MLRWLVLFFISPLTWAAPSFTTVSYDGEKLLYLGIRNQNEPGSWLVEYDHAAGSHKAVKIPDDLPQRDVIGIIPEGDTLFVLTNNPDSTENPRLWTFQRASGSWKELAKAPCPGFAKITLGKSHLVFHCEMGLTRRGKTKYQRKPLFLSKERIHLRGFVRVPDFLIRHKGLSVFLEGAAPYWEKMRIRLGEDEKFVTASSLIP